TSSRSPTTPCARTPPPCSAAPSRSLTSTVRPPGCGRRIGCATCSATAIAGTPSAATCTSSTAIWRPPAPLTPRPPAARRTSPSVTASSGRPPARGRLAGEHHAVGAQPRLGAGGEGIIRGQQQRIVEAERDGEVGRVIRRQLVPHAPYALAQRGVRVTHQ